MSAIKRFLYDLFITIAKYLAVIIASIPGGILYGLFVYYTKQESLIALVVCLIMCIPSAIMLWRLSSRLQKIPRKYEFMYVKLGNTWEAWENDERNEGGFCLNWAAKNIGFGELIFIKEKGKVICYTECMNKRFIDAAMMHFLNNIELIDE